MKLTRKAPVVSARAPLPVAEGTVAAKRPEAPVGRFRERAWYKGPKASVVKTKPILKKAFL